MADTLTGDIGSDRAAMDFLPRAKLLMRKEWQEIWNCCDGNKLHAINPTVGVTKQNDSRSRRDAVILNRLQIGHTRATHACTSSW